MFKLYVLPILLNHGINNTSLPGAREERAALYSSGKAQCLPEGPVYGFLTNKCYYNISRHSATIIRATGAVRGQSRPSSFSAWTRVSAGRLYSILNISLSPV